MRHIPSRTARRWLQAVAMTASLLAGAVPAQPLQTAAVGSDTPLRLLLTDAVRQVPYNPYASHPGVRWKSGKDAGPEAEGTIQLSDATGKPSVQAVLSVERDARGRTTSVTVLIPPSGRQKPSTQFREILRQQLEPGVTVTLIADSCAWDEGGMEPWSKDVFMRLNWPAERRVLFVRGRLKAWPDASSSAIHSAFFFDAEDPSQLIEQMGCRRARQP